MTFLSEEEIRAFYEKQDFSPLFKLDPKFFKWRQIRLMLSNGKFLKIRRNVSSPQALQKILLKFLPVKAYYMVARFSQPRSVGARDGPKGAGYVVADNCFLFQDEFVFDVDEDPEKNLPALISYLREKGFPIKYICFSGKRGYHVCIKRPIRLRIEDPRSREQLTLAHNKALIEDVLSRGIAVDDTSNTRQIVKIPLSLDATTGNECFLVRNPFGFIGLGNLRRGDDREPFAECNTEDGGGASPTPRPQFNLLLCVSNNVLGTRGQYVPFLKFEGAKKERVRAILKKIRERYGIGSFYVFEDEEVFVAVSLEIVSFERLMKILRFAKQWGYLNALRKYKHNLLELSFFKKPVAYTPRGGRSISKGHLHLLRVYGVPNLPSGDLNFAGNGKVRIGLYASK